MVIASNIRPEPRYQEDEDLNGDGFLVNQVEDIGFSQDGDLADESDHGDKEDAKKLWETTVLPMPSSISMAHYQELGVVHLANQELKIHKGQANDWIKDLKLALAHQAVILRTEVQNANNSHQRTHAWDKVHWVGEP